MADTLDATTVPDTFRSGYVAVIGRPNVGKSSLMNKLVGERLAPTSPVPQTTRRRLLGILSDDIAQIVFEDTPGLHDSGLLFNQTMVHNAEESLVDADIVMMVVDATREPGAEDQMAYDRAQGCKAPRLLVVNKMDLGEEASFPAEHQAKFAADAVHEVSAMSGEGLTALVDDIVARLPVHPPYFPPDQISDVIERDIAADIIREAAMRNLHQELPHSIAVLVLDWKDRANGMTYIRAEIYVERESQKGMVIGKKGAMLRSIGAQGRLSLEQWLQSKVYLELEVKVLPDWRKSDHWLKYLGLVSE